MTLLFRTRVCWILVTASMALGSAQAQDRTTYMRLAKITVDSARLADYLVALKTQMQAALNLEKGVLGYSAVQDKNHPHRLTLLETYASRADYEAHIQTEHFKRYKAAVADMVTHLELTDVIPIAIQLKQSSK